MDPNTGESSMIWLGTNDGGALIEDATALISVDDRGLTVGEGVFETVAVYGGQPFAIDRHLARLIQSAEILELPHPNLQLIREAVDQVLAANASVIGDLGRLRITFTAGRKSTLPTIVVTCMGQPQWPDSTSVITVPWVRNERSPIAGAKSTSYAENSTALKFAQAQGASEAVLANTVGHLCEGTTSNVFVVIGGEVLTPPLTSGCLPGVTRGLVIELFDVKERDIPYSALGDIEELFLTSTTRGIHPVTSLDGRSIDVGSISQELRRAFIAQRHEMSNP